MDIGNQKGQRELIKPLGQPITRKQAIKVGGIAAVGLAFSKPLIETVWPKPAFAQYAPPLPPPKLSEGCTPGYWKVPQHFDSWIPTGFTIGQSVASVFSAASAFPLLGHPPLLLALYFGGGPGTRGAAKILLRAAVAAALNAAHPTVNYPRSLSQVVNEVNAALASGDRQKMTDLATELDNDNNLGCALN